MITLLTLGSGRPCGCTTLLGGVGVQGMGVNEAKVHCLSMGCGLRPCAALGLALARRGSEWSPCHSAALALPVCAVEGWEEVCEQALRWVGRGGALDPSQADCDFVHTRRRAQYVCACRSVAGCMWPAVRVCAGGDVVQQNLG